MAFLVDAAGAAAAVAVVAAGAAAAGAAAWAKAPRLKVAAIKGNAVFFSYDRAHASTRTLHGGAPVLAGEKWVATKWLREREFI